MIIFKHDLLIILVLGTAVYSYSLASLLPISTAVLPPGDPLPITNRLLVLHPSLHLVYIVSMLYCQFISLVMKLSDAILYWMFALSHTV